MLDEPVQENIRSKPGPGDRWWSIRIRLAVDHLAQPLQTGYGVEVQEKDQVRLLHRTAGDSRFVRLEKHQVLDTRHPVQKIGVFVGHDTSDAMPHLQQRLAPRQRRAHGIPVGIRVRHDHDILRRPGKQFAQPFYIFLGNHH